jgi:transcriptional regulator with XRE-family HTH domain
MSPTIHLQPAPAAVNDALRRVWATFGASIREARLTRRWSTLELANRAGVSRSLIFALERGEGASAETAVRVAMALGLRVELDLVDPRRQTSPSMRSIDPVHSLMGEFEAAHFRTLGPSVSLDEPYQHYQFAGRADVVAWDLASRALLHIENRTRFPDFQETAGAYNAKRAYLGNVLAERLGIHRWASETHVLAALWSAEVLHALRLRTQSFLSICPDEPSGFEAWWAGDPPKAGRTSAIVVLDPLAAGRQRIFVGLSDALQVRARHHGYADIAQKLLRPRSG